MVREWLGEVEGGEAVVGIYCMREEELKKQKGTVQILRFLPLVSK